MDEWRYRELYELEDRHWWFRGRRAVMWALLQRVGLPPSPRILDAGCGTGRNLVELGQLGAAEGVDTAEEAVSFCRRRGLDGVTRAELEELPYEDGRFDLVVATDVIEHIEDDRRALGELRRVADRGARLVVTVPAYSWLWSDHDVSMHHRRRYTLRRLGDRVATAGWQPVASSYFFSTMLPAVATVRLARRALPDRFSRSDLELSPSALGRALELPVRAEANLIARGVRLPAGVSVGMACAAR